VCEGNELRNRKDDRAAEYARNERGYDAKSRQNEEGEVLAFEHKERGEEVRYLFTALSI
jgi:hypothetical protein